MMRTSIRMLVLAAVLVGVGASILTWGFYGNMPPFGASVSTTLWIMTLVCAGLAWWVRAHLNKGRIGLDRTQLDPMTAAQFLVIGKASAWTGAIVSGVYGGIATYVVPNSTHLVAASDDLPGVLISFFGAVALSISGVVLERNCVAPPPQDPESA